MQRVNIVKSCRFILTFNHTFNNNNDIKYMIHSIILHRNFLEQKVGKELNMMAEVHRIGTGSLWSSVVQKAPDCMQEHLGIC